MTLHQHLQKPELWLAVQLRTGKKGLKTFLYEASMLTGASSLCSCGRGSQTAKQILIHYSAFSAAQNQLGDSQGNFPDFKQLLSFMKDYR